MGYQVLARKWRPQTFEAVVGQGPVTRTLLNALLRGRIAHAYLFAGPRGVGKTTTARLLAKGLNCAGPKAGEPCNACPACREIAEGRSLDVIEIDGASNRGIDEVRALRENVRYAPSRGRYKVYIIDEVHMLTEPAFNALLKTLEEPPPHVVFVLATTEPRRIPPTILSRCQRFDFRPIPPGEIVAALEAILGQEQVACQAEALPVIARAAEGSLRDALSLLDTALAYGGGQVRADELLRLLGSGGAEAVAAFIRALLARDAAGALQGIAGAAGEGHDLALLSAEATESLRRLLLLRLLPSPPPELAPQEVEALEALGPETSVDDLLLLVKGLVEAEAEMRRSPHPRIDLEVAAVRLCRRPSPTAIETVLERVEAAETRLRQMGIRETPRPGPVQPDLLGAEPPRPPSPRPPAPGPAGPGPQPSPDASALPNPPAEASSAGRGPAALRERWRQVVAEVSGQKPTFGHILAEAEVVGEEEGRLLVHLPNGNAFTREQLEHRANRQLLHKAVQQVFPEVREVAFVPADPRRGATPSPLAHPAVRAAIELFDGEVLTIRPPGPGEEEA